MQGAFWGSSCFPGKAGSRRQPVDPLGYASAVQAVDTTHRQLQQDALIQRVTTPHLADVLLVDQRVGFGTPAANR